MNRVIARLPESITELCLVRLGLQAHKLSAWPYAARLGRSINKSAVEAVAAGAGLLLSEPFRLGRAHHGVLQYWTSFEAMEAWSHRPPHSEWWREAVERMRTRGDFGVYHETYLVPRARIESIYLDCRPTGLLAFGAAAEPVGRDTNSRGRLGMEQGRTT